MSTVKAIQGTIDQLVSDTLPDVRVIELVRHASPLVRMNAIACLVRRAAIDESLIDHVLAAIADPVNRFRLMGTVTVADEAICLLLQSGIKRACEEATKLVLSEAEPKRTDLIERLESRRVPFPNRK
jgi:hypothetical protein